LINILQEKNSKQIEKNSNNNLLNNSIKEEDIDTDNTQDKKQRVEINFNKLQEYFKNEREKKK